MYRYFEAPPDPAGQFAPHPLLAKRQHTADMMNAVVAFGMLGGALGLALGLAGGSARRSIPAGLAAALVGLLMGAGLGAGISFILVPIYSEFFDPAANSILLPLLIHGGIWTIIGAAGGLAFGLGLGDRQAVLRSLLGGAVGAFLGTLVYDLAGALAFPFARTDQPISITWGTRLLARLLVATCATAGAVLAVRSPKPGPESLAQTP